jgi:hypothetical protein
MAVPKKRKSKSVNKMAQPAKPGRKPERLKIEGKWTDAVKHVLTRGKPKKEIDT